MLLLISSLTIVIVTVSIIIAEVIQDILCLLVWFIFFEAAQTEKAVYSDKACDY